MSIIKFCLDCDREIDVGPSPKMEQRVSCPHCDVILEIINIDPLELDWVYDGPTTNIQVFDDWWGISRQGPVTSSQ